MVKQKFQKSCNSRGIIRLFVLFVDVTARSVKYDLHLVMEVVRVLANKIITYSARYLCITLIFVF